MTTTREPLTKTRVADLTRSIRRDALRVKDMVETLDSARNLPTYRGEQGEPLIDALRRFPQYERAVYDLLGDIDGVSAQLREVLGLDDR
jgi:hypothetical protein